LKVIILAAGEGKRLRPLTEDKPKCMVNLLGKSLLEHQLSTYQKVGISDIIVVTGYKSDSIGFPSIKYYKNEKYDSTNMVETLFCVENELNDSVILSYGDIIFEKTVLEKLMNVDEDFAIVIDKEWKKYWSVRFENPLNDLESLKLDKNGYIKKIGQKVSDIAQIQGQYIGLMKFQGESLDFIKRFYHQTKNEAKNGNNPLNPKLPFEKSFMTDFLQGLINAGCKLKAVPISNGWLELDTIADFNIYNTMYKNKEISQFIDLSRL
jgi:choline kinase